MINNACIHILESPVCKNLDGYPISSEIVFPKAQSNYTPSKQNQHG